MSRLSNRQNHSIFHCRWRLMSPHRHFAIFVSLYIFLRLAHCLWYLWFLFLSDYFVSLVIVLCTVFPSRLHRCRCSIVVSWHTLEYKISNQIPESIETMFESILCSTEIRFQFSRCTSINEQIFFDQNLFISRSSESFMLFSRRFKCGARRRRNEHEFGYRNSSVKWMLQFAHTNIFVIILP